MGEASKRKRGHHDLLRRNPWCIYCGAPADTVEHMPPMMMFRAKQRPKGLEFPSCQPCNNGTAHSDLVASTLGRAMVEEEADRGDVRKLYEAMMNNTPAVVVELQRMRPIRQRQALRRLGVSPEFGMWTVDGPLVAGYMLTFAAKLDFALHFELFEARVPQEGGVYPLWFSNVQALEGELPQALLHFVPELRTLRQGLKHVGDQFLYSARKTQEGHNGLFYAQFRQAFAVAGVTALDRSFFYNLDPNFSPIIKPGDLKYGITGGIPGI